MPEKIEPYLEQEAREGGKEGPDSLASALTLLGKNLRNMESGVMPDMGVVTELDVQLAKELDSDSDLIRIKAFSNIFDSAVTVTRTAVRRAESPEDQKRIYEELYGVYKKYLEQLGQALQAIEIRLDGFDEYIMCSDPEGSIKDFYGVVDRFLTAVDDERLMADVSHNFRTALGSIMNNLSVELATRFKRLSDKLEEVRTANQWNVGWQKKPESVQLDGWPTIPSIREKTLMKIRQYWTKFEGRDRFHPLYRELSREKKEEIYAEYIDPLCKRLGFERSELEEAELLADDFEEYLKRQREISDRVKMKDV